MTHVDTAKNSWYNNSTVYSESNVIVIPVPSLKVIRNRRLLTMDQLNELSGVSKVTLVRAEAGRGVYPATIKKLARALRVRAAVLTQKVQEG
jgi:DNA-binding XRE family transcriptional regulator